MLSFCVLNILFCEAINSSRSRARIYPSDEADMMQVSDNEKVDSADTDERHFSLRIAPINSNNDTKLKQQTHSSNASSLVRCFFCEKKIENMNDNSSFIRRCGGQRIYHIDCHNKSMEKRTFAKSKRYLLPNDSGPNYIQYRGKSATSYYHLERCITKVAIFAFFLIIVIATQL